MPRPTTLLATMIGKSLRDLESSARHTEPSREREKEGGEGRKDGEGMDKETDRAEEMMIICSTVNTIVIHYTQTTPVPFVK